MKRFFLPFRRCFSLALFLLVLMLPLMSSAYVYRICVDGFYYDIDSETMTATLTYEGDRNYYQGLSGVIEIPSSIIGTYDNLPYTVTSIKGAFSHCTDITSVIIPNTVTRIDTRAFYFCRNLQSLTIPSSVTHIGSEAFYFCGFSSISIPNSVTTIDKGAFHSCENLVEITIPESVTEISDWLFAHCHNLETINLPNTITSVGDGAFSYCYKLANLELPSSVTSIGEHVFSESNNLTHLTLPNALVEIKKETFWNLKGLKSVKLGDRLETIGDKAFYGCSALESISSIPASVKSIGWEAFYGCDMLADIEVLNPDVHIGWQAFFDTLWFRNQSKEPGLVVYLGDIAYCGKFSVDDLEDVDTCVIIREGTKSIAANAFYGISNLNIDLPNSLTFIDEYAFYHSLICVKIPNSVKRIGRSAFENSSIKSVCIPESVDTIGCLAFAGTDKDVTLCGNAKVGYSYSEYIYNHEKKRSAFDRINTLCLMPTVKDISNYLFQPKVIYSFGSEPPRCNNKSFNMEGIGTPPVVHVPAGTKEAYSNAEYWNQFTIVDDAVQPMTLKCDKDTIMVHADEIFDYPSVSLAPTDANVPLTWVSSRDNIVLPYNNNKLRATRPGEADLYVTCANLIDTCHIIVIGEKLEMHLDQTEVRLELGQELTLHASHTPEDASTKYYIRNTDPKVVSITTNADNSVITLHPNKCGTATITVGFDMFANNYYSVPATCTVTVSSPKELNGDGYVDVGDVNAVLENILAGGLDPNLDVNGDGEVNVGDVNALLEFILELK